MPSILGDLRLEIGDASLLRVIDRLFAGESLRQQQEMFAGNGKRSLALPRLGVDLPLTQLERSLLDVVLNLELTQPLAGGVVVIRGPWDSPRRTLRHWKQGNWQPEGATRAYLPPRSLPR